jgi:hypothetical protein
MKTLTFKNFLLASEKWKIRPPKLATPPRRQRQRLQKCLLPLSPFLNVLKKMKPSSFNDFLAPC